jgi:hypothetical protein
MNLNSYRTSLRFTAQSNQTVNKIRVYIDAKGSGTSPIYSCGLQANIGGSPSNTWLGYGDLTAAAAGWQTVTLTQPVSLTAGTVYHIVVLYKSGTIGSSNYIALRRSTPQNSMLPYDGASDSNSNTLWYNGSWWSTQGYQPIYLLETATPTYEGNPCEAYTNQGVYGASYSGEKLTISGGDQLATHLGFYVKTNSSTSPADNLYYQIRDSNNAVVRSGTLVTRTAITTYGWYDAQLSSPLTLVNGATYRVNLSSNGSSSSYHYQVLRNDNTDNATYNGRNYNGTGSVYCSSTSSGSNWADNSQYDIPFRLTTIPNISITQYSISTVGYTGIVLSYSYWGYYSGTNPQLKVEWKPSSSGTWNTLDTHTLTSSSPTTPSWNLPAEADNISIDIRFTDLTVSTREARVDDVKVSSSVLVNTTPVCMPDQNEDSDFLSEDWEYDSPYWEYRWSLTWDFDHYPHQDDPVWNEGSLCEGYEYVDYDPYLLLHPGEIFEIVFQARGTLTYSGSYFNEVFVKIYEGDWYEEDEWIYSWPTGTVIVPQYDLQAETLNSVLRANAMLGPEGHWWRSWNWWKRR